MNLQWTRFWKWQTMCVKYAVFLGPCLAGAKEVGSSLADIKIECYSHCGTDVYQL